MANLLAHALFALALYAVPSSLIAGTPLTEQSFYAALVALLPDLELGAGGRGRSPLGHSIAYTLFWALLGLSGLSLAAWTGPLPRLTVLPLFGAFLVGLGSHLLLDALREPGIFTWPGRGGPWGRFSFLRQRGAPELNLPVAAFSIGAVLTLLVLY